MPAPPAATGPSATGAGYRPIVAMNTGIPHRHRDAYRIGNPYGFTPYMITLRKTVGTLICAARQVNQRLSAMGQTLTIWKWRTGWPFRSVSRVMSSLEQDRPPFSLVRFDAKAFADEIHHRFGNGEERPFHVDVCDFTGNHANWLSIGSGWGQPEKLTELVQMCKQRGLNLYVE